MATKFIRNAEPQMNIGTRNAERSICRIHIFPPMRAYNAPPKYPFTGEVAAYTNIAVDKSEPRLKTVIKKLCFKIY